MTSANAEMVEALLRAQINHISDLKDCFQTWDKDGDGIVDMNEFQDAMKALKLPGHDDDEKYNPVCVEVFRLYDIDGSGRIVYREYIRHTLRKAFEQSTAKAIDLFREWDINKSGKITKDEWRRAMAAIGFGNAPQAEVDGLFDEIDIDRTGELEYEELNKALRGLKESKKRMPTHNEMVEALLKTQANFLSELRDCFQTWDKDGDGIVDKKEFQKAMRALKLPGHDDDEKYNPVCDEVFRMHDTDGSGRIVYREYIRHTLRKAFEQSTTKAIDLFREWDFDKSGKISKDEWRRAMAAIGFGNAPQAEVDGLFDEIDSDCSGELEYEELNKALRVGSKDLVKRSNTAKLERAKTSARLGAKAKAKAANLAAAEAERAEQEAAAERARNFELPPPPSPHFPNASSSCPMLPSSSRPPSPVPEKREASSLCSTPDSTPRAESELVEEQSVAHVKMAYRAAQQRDDEQWVQAAELKPVNEQTHVTNPTATKQPLATNPTRQISPGLAACQSRASPQHRPASGSQLRPQPLADGYHAHRQRPATAGSAHARSQPALLVPPLPVNRYAFLKRPSRRHVYAPPPARYEGAAPVRQLSAGMLATLTSINFDDPADAVAAKTASTAGHLQRSWSTPGIAPGGVLNTHLWADTAIRSGTVLKSQLMMMPPPLLPRAAFKSLPPLYGQV